MQRFLSKGTLHYTVLPAIKLAVDVDPELSRFYRSLIPKSAGINLPMFDPHISVVRKEQPLRMEFWGKYEGEIVEFEYDPYVHIGRIYCWLNVFCCRLEKIREELGLEVHSEITRPPVQFRQCFHLTLGNFKKR